MFIEGDVMRLSRQRFRSGVGAARDENAQTNSQSLQIVASVARTVFG